MAAARAASSAYTAKASPAATKTNTPLIETPQAVSVITRTQLDDRNVQTFSDALADPTGATVNVAGFDPRFDQIFIRGDTFSAFPTSSLLQGLTLGGGIRYVGASFADDENTVRNAGYRYRGAPATVIGSPIDRW